jgi:hypothetical protein
LCVGSGVGISKVALYHGVENDVDFVSSRPTSRDLNPILEDANLEEVLMGYPNISQAPFTNLIAFKRSCMRCLRRLVKVGVKRVLLKLIRFRRKDKVAYHA